MLLNWGWPAYVGMGGAAGVERMWGYGLQEQRTEQGGSQRSASLATRRTPVTHLLGGVEGRRVLVG